MPNGQVALGNRLDSWKVSVVDSWKVSVELINFYENEGLDSWKVSVDNRDPNLSNKKAKQKHYKHESM